MSTTTSTAHEHLKKQRDYVKSRHLQSQAAAAKNAGASGMVDERMLAESMRSVRYLDEAHAAGDIIDNAIEAGASQLRIAYQVERGKVTGIAFIDDASGIDPSFLPHATKWGGSSNVGSRNTFGRFGFGLPSASVNRGRRYSVYSRTASDEEFSSVTVDLDNLAGKDGIVPLPRVERRELPGWVRGHAEKHMTRGLEDTRTVVVWENLDRIEWTNKTTSVAKMREHLGITYASWLDVCEITVDGEAVEPVDVLFTTPGYRWHKIDGYPEAQPQSPMTVEMRDKDGNKHPVTIRFSYIGVDAYDARVPTGAKGAPPKIRQKVRSRYNGVFVTRHGRFIELAKPEFITWNNYARQVGMAIDFPPELDDLFGVTPDKQTIMISEAAQKALEAAGVVRAFKALQKAVQDERALRRAEEDAKKGGDDGDDQGERPSETAIKQAVEKSFRKTRKASPEAEEEAERNFKEKVKRIAKDTGLPEDKVRDAQEESARQKPYRVEFAKETEDQPFYTPLQEGPQLILRINTAHPWYRELYSRLGLDAQMRSGLELMLFVLATCELDASAEARVFYRGERREWSKRMADAFDYHPLVFTGAASRDEVDDHDPAAWAEDDDATEESA